MKKFKNEAITAAVVSYLERRNYSNRDLSADAAASCCYSAEQMAVSAIIEGESGRSNSILFSSINNDTNQYDLQFNSLVSYIKSIGSDTVQNELSNILCPLLCHMYLEMLRGGHRNSAQMFLKKNSAILPQKEFGSSMCYNHQSSDGNLPSALYRPNSLEQLFHSLQNGTIDNEIPEKDFVYQILDDLGSIFTLQDIELKPAVTAFRSCKYVLQLSLESVNYLKKFLSKHSHIVLIQVFQTWFHFDIVNQEQIEESDDTMEEVGDYSNDFTNNVDSNDDMKLCNGHMDFIEDAKELGELQEAIRSVRESIPPLKLFKIATSDTSLTCATMDNDCRKLIAGFSSSEIRIWATNGAETLSQKQVNGNLSNVELACYVTPDDTPNSDIFLDPSVGICLRGHSGSVHSVNLLESVDKSGILVSTSHDTTIRAWRMSDYSCAAIYRGHNYPVWCLDIAKHGVFMASGSYDRTAKLWSLDRTFPLRIFAGHNLDVNTISFHPNGNYIATGSADKTIRLWCVSTGQQVRLFPGHRGSVYSLAFSPDGKLIASGSEDKRIKIWDIASGNCLHDFKGHQGSITNLEWNSAMLERSSSSKLPEVNGTSKTSSEYGCLLSTSMDGSVKLWDCQFKHKSSSSSQEPSPTTFNSKCSHLVMARMNPDWFIGVGSVLI